MNTLNTLLQKHRVSLFSYIIDLPNQVGKVGRITAKTEKDAKEQIAEKHPEGKNLILEAEASVTQKAVKKAAKKATKKTTTAKGLTKLEKYIYLQHGKCFFCGEKLTQGNASIEHLNPVSRGGSRTEDNEVACCATVNHTFGDMDLKRKFEFVLRSSNDFKCPKVKRETAAPNQPKIIDPTPLDVTPENHGMQWTEKEEKQLISRYNQKMSIEMIAQKHKRGLGAISARLVKLGQLQEEGES
jgi:5-methylcytosine-specific restriction endonuclease McrA